MSRALDETVRCAVAEGLLPAGAVQPEMESRPWPVVLLTVLGAWLAAIPLTIVVGFLFSRFISDGAGAYLVGLMLLAASVAALRLRTLPLFVEQLAVPGLLVGAGTLAIGLFRDLPYRVAALVLAAIALVLVLALARAWLRVLLGATAAVLIGGVLAFNAISSLIQTNREWVALHALLLSWLMALWWQRSALENGAQARHAAAVEAAGAGWVLATLAGLAWVAGLSVLAAPADTSGLAMPSGGSGFSYGSMWKGEAATHVASALLSMLGAVWAVRAWPTLRQPALAGVALVLAALSFLLPTLGAVLLVLAFTATRHRFDLAAAAGVAATWIVGSFCYQLDLTLAHKAAIFAACGALLGALAWWMVRGASDAAPAGRARPWQFDRPARWLAFGTLATCAVAAFGIWQKEELIRHGRPVFLPMQPLDPRMLGDSLRLDFLSAQRQQLWTLPRPDAATARPWAVARLDPRGVATVLRLVKAGSPLAEGEVPIELTPDGSSWTLVTEAWFFKHGEAERWAAARYGEFRVTAAGQALLVGVADAELHQIHP